jgi:hypothetical protein
VEAARDDEAMSEHRKEPSHNDTCGQDEWNAEREFATLVALMRCADRWTAVRAQALFRWRAKQCLAGPASAMLAMQATHREGEARAGSEWSSR